MFASDVPWQIIGSLIRVLRFLSYAPNFRIRITKGREPLIYLAVRLDKFLQDFLLIVDVEADFYEMLRKDLYLVLFCP